MLKLDTKPGIIFSAIVSIGFTIAYLAVADDYYYFIQYLELGRHISCLQILSSAALIVGVFKQNFKLFVPWMISTALFIYTMVYLTIVLLTQSNYEYWFFVYTMTAPFSVYLTCALIAVKKAFDRLREDQPESQISLTEKKNVLSHI
ncbi:hypothetical protein KR054_001673 [Drosophila jambulina]|nr:hypothetical protein KR054_001673 [Drosophila jambulina]